MTRPDQRYREQPTLFDQPPPPAPRGLPPSVDHGPINRDAKTFAVGDCVILNEVDAPIGQLIAVVVGVYCDLYACKYLNTDPRLNQFNSPPMVSRLLEATKLEDFGVELQFDGDKYWAEPVRESCATYADGTPRQWQDHHGPIRHRFRRDVAEIITFKQRPTMKRRDQPSLLDQATPSPPPAPATVDHGPINRDATHAITLPHHPADRARVLDIIYRAGRNGATLKEIADRLNKSPHEVSGRLTELAARGLIRRPGPTRQFKGAGRPCVVCYCPQFAPTTSTPTTPTN
jgi:hypothetical protein